MSGIIGISSAKKEKNNPAIISNFRHYGEIEPYSFMIKYTAIDKDHDQLTHYIKINDQKKEITKEIKYDIEYSYKIENLTPNTTYNIQVEVSDGKQISKSSVLSVKTSSLKFYGVKVMENNSNPNTSVSYIENAIGINTATQTSLGGWADKYPFNEIRIVGFKNGKVTKEINPNNKIKYIDNSSVPIDVDVMVEIPKFYWKFTDISNGYELRICKYKFDGSDCYAHKIGGVEKDYIYVGAYIGSSEGGKLRSRSGATPTSGKSISQYRKEAQANGIGYQSWNWFSQTALQILYLIAYRNLDSQTALGKGYTFNGSFTTTGGTNTKGMIFGENSGNQQMCFLGVEDFWGNYLQWCDGVFINGSRQLTVINDNKNFNDNGTGYKIVGQIVNMPGESTSKVIHTNEGAFFAKEFGGSSTTYYCDYGCANTNSFGYFGGYHNNMYVAGAFCMDVRYPSTHLHTLVGSRLCYLG